MKRTIVLLSSSLLLLSLPRLGAGWNQGSFPAGSSGAVGEPTFSHPIDGETNALSETEASAAPAAAGTGAPQGQPMTVVAVVRDAADGHPITGIAVTNLATGETAVSDDTGSAVFSEQAYPLGLLRLAAEGPGYVSRLYARELPEDMCGQHCEDPVFTMTLAMDPIDWMISPPVGPEGGSHTVSVATGIVLQGETDEYMQSFALTVPQNAWQGEYRLGFTPIRYRSFDYYDYSIPASGMYPVAGFTFRFLDPDTKAPVAGEPIAEPLVIILDPAYVKDLDVRPATVAAWRVDVGGRDFTTRGVVSTELVQGAIRIVVDQPGTYQVFAGEVSLPDPLPAAAPVEWHLCEPFQWEPCSINGPDGNGLPLFACTTYTNGQAEPIQTTEAKTKQQTTHFDGSISVEVQAKLALVTGADFKAAVDGGTEWTTTSEWTKETAIGTRVYDDPPLCGEVCISVKAGVLHLCEVVGSRGEDGAMVWTPTGNTKEFIVTGPVCIADDLAPCE